MKPSARVPVRSLFTLLGLAALVACETTDGANNKSSSPAASPMAPADSGNATGVSNLSLDQGTQEIFDPSAAQKALNAPAGSGQGGATSPLDLPPVSSGGGGGLSNSLAQPPAPTGGAPAASAPPPTTALSQPPPAAGGVPPPALPPPTNNAPAAAGLAPGQDPSTAALPPLGAENMGATDGLPPLPTGGEQVDPFAASPGDPAASLAAPQAPLASGPELTPGADPFAAPPPGAAPLQGGDPAALGAAPTSPAAPPVNALAAPSAAGAPPPSNLLAPAPGGNAGAPLSSGPSLSSSGSLSIGAPPEPPPGAAAGGTEAGKSSASMGGKAPTEKKPRVVRQLTEAEREAAKKAIGHLRNLAPGEAPQEYVIQHGDTLWDISDQFLDDPGWWPKLWSFNPSIENPNLIFPGNKLVFYSSNGQNAPQVDIRDKGDPLAQTSGGAKGADTLKASLGSAPQFNVDEPRFTKDQLVDGRALPNAAPVESIGDFTPSTAIPFRMPGILSTFTPDHVGQIKRFSFSPVAGTQDTRVWAEFKDPPQAGERYLALRENDEVEDPESHILSTHMWSYTGTVGVMANPGSNASAIPLMVEESTLGVMPGDILIPWKKIYKAIDPASTGRRSEARARVMAVLDGAFMLAGHWQTVFFRKPEEGQVNEGEDLVLYMPPGSVTHFTAEGVPGDEVATARVVEVWEDGFLGIIWKQTREVSVGAQTWPEF